MLGFLQCDQRRAWYSTCYPVLRKISTKQESNEKSCINIEQHSKHWLFWQLLLILNWFITLWTILILLNGNKFFLTSIISQFFALKFPNFIAKLSIFPDFSGLKKYPDFPDFIRKNSRFWGKWRWEVYL